MSRRNISDALDDAFAYEPPKPESEDAHPGAPIPSLSPPGSPAEMREWLAHYAGVSLPHRACCPEHTSPLDAVWMAYRAEDPRMVWHASRGFGGKCQDADERVLLPDGRRPRWRDLVGTEFEVFGPADGAPAPVTAVAVDNGDEPVLEIRLDSGIAIRRTPNHPIMVGEVERRRGGMVYVPDRSWRMAGELAEGDLVLVPDRMPVTPRVGWAPSDEEVFLTGLMLGDGSFRHFVRFSAANPGVRAAFLRCAISVSRTSRRGSYRWDDAGGPGHEELAAEAEALGVVRTEDSRGALVLTSPDGAAYKGPRRAPGRSPAHDLFWRSGLYGKHSHEKFVPPWVFALPDDQVRVFLAGLLVTDGHVYVDGDRGRVSWSSISPELVEGVRTLFHRLGHRTTLRERRVPGGRFNDWSGEIHLARPADALEDIGALPGKEDAREAVIASRGARSYRHGWRCRGAPDGYHWEKVRRVVDLGLRPTVAVETETAAFCGPVVEHNSVALACLVYVEGLTLGAEVTLLGGSLEQSRRVHDYLQGERRSLSRGQVFWSSPNAPTYMLDGDPLKRLTKLRNGGSIEVLTASQRSVRGPHPQRLRGDEIDEMDPDIWDAAQGQPQAAMGIREQVVGSSTWHNADGTMTRELKTAKQQGFRVARWCWRCVLDENGGWLTREDAERKFATIPAYMRAIEYDLERPAVTGVLIHEDALDRLFDRDIGYHAGDLGARVEFEPPQPNATYAAGADWGKSRDRSIIVVVRTDVSPRRIVYYAHMGRVPFPAMVAVFNEQVARYEASSCHDATGIGAVIDDYLEVLSEGVKMVGNTRRQLFSEYVAAVEQGAYRHPTIDYMQDEHMTCTVDDIYGAGHPPDTVVAMAMAHRAAESLGLMI